MEKINIAELLKDCPQGMELDCTICNGVKFIELDRNPNFPIVVRANNGYEFSLTKYGQVHNIDDAKCVIFPKGKTTWEGFHRPFKDGDIVYIRDEYSDATFTYVAIFKQIKGGQIYSHCFYNYEDAEFSTDDYLYDIYRIRFATEEEKAKLFDTIKDNGYKWNPETNTLEKLIEPKFKVGDTITNGKISITIGYIDNEYYYETSRNIANRLFIKEQDAWNLISEKFPNKTTALCDVINAINEGCKSLMEKTIKIDIPAGYEFAGVDDDNQQVLLKKIKPKYPKDFDECCYILETSVDAYFDYDDNNHYPNDYEYGLEKKLLCLRKLLICRDAYWKLIGENMGLDKPWEPDWNGFGNPSYPTIVRCNNRIIKTSLYTNDCLLVFPTEETRDIFYENFKDLIEQCKELLLFV